MKQQTTGESRWLSGIPKSEKEGKRESKVVRRTVEGYVFSAQMGRRRKVSCTASQLYLCSLWRAGLSLQSTKVNRRDPIHSAAIEDDVCNMSQQS